MARALIQSMASLSEHTRAKAKLGCAQEALNSDCDSETDQPTVRRNAAYQGPLDERNTSSRYRTTSLNFGRFSGAVMINAS